MVWLSEYWWTEGTATWKALTYIILDWIMTIFPSGIKIYKWIFKPGPNMLIVKAEKIILPLRIMSISLCVCTYICIYNLPFAYHKNSEYFYAGSFGEKHVKSMV